MRKFVYCFFSVLLSIIMLFSLLPTEIVAAEGSYVTREQAVVGLLETVGFDALYDTDSDLSIFSDADTISSEHVDQIEKAVSNGILIGTPSRVLRPKENITRLEFALTISRSIREMPDICHANDFFDVPTDYKGHINKICRAGIMEGYSADKFGSADYVTKEQLDVILQRINELSETRYQDDFFYASNYDWLSSTKLPAGYPMVTSFDEVNISNNGKMKVIVNDLVKNIESWEYGTKEQKMADFYTTILDVESRNKEGIEPIQSYLELINNVQTIQELIDINVQFENELGFNLLFSFSPSVDFLDSSRYSLYVSGLSTTLPSTYILSENPQISMLYGDFIVEIFRLSGLPEETAKEYAKDVYALEKVVAQHTLSNEDASRIENIYNSMEVKDIDKMFTEVDIDDYIKMLGYNDVGKVIAIDPGLLEKTGELLSNSNLETLKAYSSYRMVLGTASYLSEELENTVNAFNSAFLGISSSMTQEDRAFNLLNSVMSNYLGEVYVEKYFSKEAKNDVEEIVLEIISTFENRINKLDWMTDTTKEAAISKLKAMNMKIGYPDTWEDNLAAIEIKTYEDGGSLLENIFAITSVSVSQAKELLDKPVDKTKWSIPPQTVNAFYSATNNEITFPAGILQPPFYDVEASREQNLGGIGAVIAHEITHAFDNNGSQFDKDGNLSNWWTKEDYEIFQKKCQKVIALYDGIEIAPNTVSNGALTVSENVADIGAMACILDIAAGMRDANYQELFENYANIWRLTGTNQIYQYLATQDVHAFNKLRVNQVIRNFSEFYDTYSVKANDTLYLAPENRVAIW